MKKTIIFLSFLLSGCAVGNDINYSMDAYDRSDMTFVGVPTILGAGILGTTFPISPHYSITAKHVAMFNISSVLAYHPTCDIAIIRKNNTKVKNFPYISGVYNEETLRNYGYSIISAMPVESEGNRINMNISYSGFFQEESCQSEYSTNGSIKGMSGGPVYNTKGNIVGVNIANAKSIIATSGDHIGENIEKYNNGVSIFVPLKNIKPWILETLSKTEDAGFPVFLNDVEIN